MYGGTQQQNEFIQNQWRQLEADTLQEYKDDWEIDSETYVKNMEDLVLNNPDVFPVLSKYYRKG